MNHVSGVLEAEAAVAGAGRRPGCRARTTCAAPACGPGIVVLDRSPGPGGAWQFRRPTLTHGGAHRVHDLPGPALRDADAGRPAAEVVSGCFAAYQDTFGPRVRRPVDVRAVRAGRT